MKQEIVVEFYVANCWWEIEPCSSIMNAKLIEEELHAKGFKARTKVIEKDVRYISRDDI